MRQTLVLFLLITGSLLGLVGYCAALMDWINDVKTGVYAQHHGEAFLETVALVVYTTLGIRFGLRRVDLF